jgi:LPXTG-motif cell wall-anchored protein
MKIQALVGLLAAFVILGMLAFLGVNWISTVPAPTNTSSDEYAQYTNLTDTVELAQTGQEGVLLLVVIAMVFLAGIILVGIAYKVI